MIEAGYDNYIELKWRSALYAIQTKLQPALPVSGDSLEHACEVERAPWTQLPRWIEEYEGDLDSFVTKVVDIGCGRGVLLALCRQILSGGPELIGVEANVNGIDFATLEDFNIKLFADNFETMSSLQPLANAQIVLMTEVLQYLRYNPVAALQQVYNIMPAGGILLLSTPDAMDIGRTFKFRQHMTACAQPSSDPTVAEEPQWFFSKKEVEACLRGAGFTVDRFGYAGIGSKHLNYQASK